MWIDDVEGKWVELEVERVCVRDGLKGFVQHDMFS